MQSQIRDYIRDFQEEFDHSTGASRFSYSSATDFYAKWSTFIGLVTGVTLINVNRDNLLDLYSISNTCSIKSKALLKIH